MAFIISDGNELVDYVKDFTGSSNDTEIRQCIFQAELAMRNIELPVLRTDPYANVNIKTADSLGRIEIPADMNKPILFFKQGDNGQQSSDGPWIVYDRIGDRDMLAGQLVANFYLAPVNVPQVIRGKFAEVGQYYEFLPELGQGDLINMYYYQAWPFLFAPIDDTLISVAGNVANVTGSGPWTAQITSLSGTGIIEPGDEITADAGTGSIGSGGTYVVATVDSSTQITFTATGGTAPQAGSVANVYLTNQVVESNGVLQSWPEGYIYGTLHEYYIKRHNAEDAAIYKAKFDSAWSTVTNQNNLSKWSGGNTRLTSVFQPRRDRTFSIK